MSKFDLGLPSSSSGQPFVRIVPVSTNLVDYDFGGIGLFATEAGIFKLAVSGRAVTIDEISLREAADALEARSYAETEEFEVMSGGSNPCPSTPFSLLGECTIEVRFSPVREGKKAVYLEVQVSRFPSVEVLVKGEGVSRGGGVDDGGDTGGGSDEEWGEVVDEVGGSGGGGCSVMSGGGVGVGYDVGGVLFLFAMFGFAFVLGYVRRRLV